MQRKGFRLGLAPKFTLALTAFVLLIMGAVVWFVQRQQSAALDRELRERGKALARAVASNASEPLSLGAANPLAPLEVAILVSNVIQTSADPAALRRAIAGESLASLVWADMLRGGREEAVSAVQNEGVLFAKVVDPAGNVIASADSMIPQASWAEEMSKPYQPEAATSLLPPGQPEQVWDSPARGGMYVIGIPVLAKGGEGAAPEPSATAVAASGAPPPTNQFATVYLAMSQGVIRRATALAVAKLLLTGLAFLALGIVAAFLIVRQIVVPVRLLRRAVLAVGAGDYQQQVTIKRADELGALANAFNGMAKGLAEREIIRNAFGSYVSQGVLDQILKDENAMKVGGVRRTITVIDTDVSGFTAMSARMTPEDVVKIINTYLDVQARIIQEYGGHIDRFVGDEIYAIWGIPEEKPDDAEKAVRCAVAIREAIAALIETQRAKHLPDPRIKIGVDTGQVVAGNMGAQGVKIEYAVVGEPVGSSHEIMDVARDVSMPGGQIVLSGNTYALVRNFVEVRDLGGVTLHGRNDPLQAYELVRVQPPRAAAVTA